jgi:hypothetical protein
MRRLVNVFALMFVTVLLPFGLVGQERAQPFFGGGLALGTADLSNDTDVGWMAFGGVDVPVGGTGVTLGVTGSHARIPYQGGFDERAQITMVSADFGYAYSGLTPRVVTPYIRLGAGLRVEQYEPGRLAAPSATQSGIGGSASAGLAFSVGGATLLLGAHLMSGRSAGYWGAQGGIGIPVGPGL